MNQQPVIILGAGGHAKVCLDLLRFFHYEVLGFTAPKTTQGDLEDAAYLGVDDEILSYSPESVNLINGVGSTGDPAVRKSLYDHFKTRGYQFITLVHPSAVVSANARLGEGVQLMAGAIVQAGSLIAENTIINTKASVDHDCKIGRHVHLAPAATLSGSVRIGDECHVGTGANIIQNLSIGAKSIVGAGSLVIKDVQEGKIVVGVPAKELN